MVSGIWHGFYPSYYILFSHFAFFMAIEDSMVLLKKVTQSGTTSEKIAMKFLEIFKCFIFFTGACFMVGILDSLHISDMYKFMKYEQIRNQIMVKKQRLIPRGEEQN